MEIISKSFMLDKRLFSGFIERASRALTKSHFELYILQDSDPPHKKNRKYCAICNQEMQYTVLNKERLDCVKPEMQVPRIDCQYMTRPIVKCTLLTLKQISFDFG